MRGGVLCIQRFIFHRRSKDENSFYLSIPWQYYIVFWGSHVSGGLKDHITEEQKEIWKLVEVDYELFKQGDLEGMSASRHDDVVYWAGRSYFPSDKNGLRNSWKHWFAADKPVKVELEPIAIKVSGNVASVFFELRYSGISISAHVRVLTTYIKQDNKWVIINGMSSSCEQLPFCR